jgi:hypothetical protein
VANSERRARAVFREGRRAAARSRPNYLAGQKYRAIAVRQQQPKAAAPRMRSRNFCPLSPARLPRPSPQRRLQRTLGQAIRQVEQGRSTCAVPLAPGPFWLWHAPGSNLHAYPYFSTVVTFALERGKQIGRTLPDGRGDRPGGRDKVEHSTTNVGYPDPLGERPRQMPANGVRQRKLLLVTGVPGCELFVVFQYAGQWLQWDGLGHGSGVSG